MGKFYTAHLVILFIFSGCTSGFSQISFDKLINQGYDSLQQQHYVAAVNLFQQAQALKGTDKSYNESVNYYLGICYDALGETDLCIGFYEKAIKYYEKENNLELLAYIYKCLGSIYFQYLNQYSEAMSYYKQQAHYLSLLQQSSSLLTCLHDIGVAYSNLSNYDSALHYFNIVLADQSPDNTIRNLALLSVADMYSSQKKYKTALRNYDSAIRAFLPLNDSLGIVTAFVNKGDCLMEQKLFKESLACLLQAQQYLNASIPDVYKKELWYNLAVVYSQTGDFKKAFEYQKRESGIKDSINTESIAKAATGAQARYEVQRNKDAVTIGRQDLKLSERKFLITLLSAVGVTLLAFLSLRNAMLRRKANRRISAEKEKVETLAGELQVANQTKARLFSVISHDLRSPVSSLYATLKMQEIKGANNGKEVVISDRIMDLLDTLEDLLTWSKSQMDKFSLHPVAVPVNSLYAELINLCHPMATSKHIAVCNAAPKNIKLHTDENLFKTVLRNMLTNSIRYAPAHSTVQMDAVTDGTAIVCSVSNDASPTDYATLQNKLNSAEVESSSHGMGTVLIQEFVQKLGAALQVTYSEGRICMQVRVPVMPVLA